LVRGRTQNGGGEKISMLPSKHNEKCVGQIKKPAEKWQIGNKKRRDIGKGEEPEGGG